MSKKIIITGKRNIDSFTNKKDKKRADSNKWNKLETFKDMDMKKQIELLNMLYLDEEYEGKEFVKKEVERKLSGYKNQDTKKKCYDKNYFISYENTLEKLVVSKLKCYYCNSRLFLLYKKRGEPMQWSLERFDNNLGHYDSNTCISCLKCNLQRRTSNHEYFKYSKNLSIKKI